VIRASSPIRKLGLEISTIRMTTIRLQMWPSVSKLADRIQPLQVVCLGMSKVF